MLPTLAVPTVSSASVQPDLGVYSDDQTRLTDYQTARDFFEGAQWEGRARAGEVRRTYNYVRALVRKTASYTFPEPIAFTVPAEAGQEEAAARAEKWLAELLAELATAEQDFALVSDALVDGSAGVKVTWDHALSRPRAVAVDPKTLWARWSPDNPTKAVQIGQRYVLPPYAIAAAFGARIEVEAKDLDGLLPVQEVWSDLAWEAKVGGQKIAGGANPFGWNPYCLFHLNRKATQYWGRSSIEDLYDAARELNSRMSVLSHILDLSGAPIAVLENVDGSENIRVGPGAKWEIPQDAKAYLLDLLAGQGVRIHIENVDLLYRILHDLAETPRTAFGDSGRNLSGAALEVEVQPLVQRVRRIRTALEGFYQARNSRFLALAERFGGQEFGGLRRTVPTWPTILPSDEESQVRNAVSLVAQGIRSRRSAAADLGEEDPEAELKRVIEEATLMAAATPSPADGEGGNGRNDRGGAGKDGADERADPEREAGGGDQGS